MEFRKEGKEKLPRQRRPTRVCAPKNSDGRRMKMRDVSSSGFSDRKSKALRRTVAVISRSRIKLRPPPQFVTEQSDDCSTRRPGDAASSAVAVAGRLGAAGGQVPISSLP